MISRFSILRAQLWCGTGQTDVIPITYSIDLRISNLDRKSLKPVCRFLESRQSQTTDGTYDL